MGKVSFTLCLLLATVALAQEDEFAKDIEKGNVDGVYQLSAPCALLGLDSDIRKDISNMFNVLRESGYRLVSLVKNDPQGFVAEGHCTYTFSR